jgi:plasmid stabilization system protein ParE
MLISEQSGMGRDRADVLSGLRGFPIGNYIIFYRPATEGIEIARICTEREIFLSCLIQIESTEVSSR